MCLIIDANCAAKFAQADAECAPVARWLRKKTSRLAIGGTKLSAEYSKVKKFLRILQALERTGQISRHDRDQVDKEQESLEKSNILTSDDPHIIALARISGCRLAYTNDVALHQDFTNNAILNPKGKIYQSAAHAHLLDTAPECQK